MFNPNQFQAVHDRMDAARGRPIIIKINTGTAFDSHASRAVFGQLTDRDLIEGSTIQQGDIKLIISSTHWPAGVPVELERGRDRIAFDGQDYAVVLCDPNARMIGEQRTAIEVTVRG